MPQTFNIVISATDKATATVKKVNDAMGKVTRPFEQAHKSFKRFDAALADNLVAKGLGNIGKAGLGAARSIGRIAAPVAAITGIGSIAGITMLADRWAKFGRATRYAAQGIGISTSDLQRYEQIATLAGVSTDGMVSSLGALGTTMEDARWGRNQGALMLLNRLGIGLKKTKSGAWDVNAELMAVARAMNSPKLKNNPWAQQLVASQLGLTALLPVLRQGETGIKKYADMQQKLGYVSSPQDIENANAFALSLAGVKISAEGLGQSIMDKAMPAIRPFLDDLSAWIGKNRELISNDVAGWVKTIADYVSKVDWKSVGDGLTGFFSNAKGSASELKEVLDDIVSALRTIRDFSHGMKYVFRTGGSLDQVFGGTQFSSADNAAYAAEHRGDAAFIAQQKKMLQTGGLRSFADFKKNAGWLESHIPESGARQDYQNYLDNYTANSLLGDHSYDWGGKPQAANPNRKRDLAAAMQFFMSKGWSKAQAAGIVANIDRESNFRAGVYGDKGAAYGLGQWHGDRQAAFAKWAGHSIVGSSMQEQLGFYNYELTQGSDKGARKAGQLLRGTKDAGMAALIVADDYERHAYNPGEDASRAGQAQQIFSAPVGPYSAGAKGSTGTVHVEVALKNAPPGTTIKAKASGSATTSTRVVQSAVGAAA
jgi:hypothetical protein